MVSKSTTLPLLVVSTVDSPEPTGHFFDFVRGKAIYEVQGVLSGHSENARGRAVCEDGGFSGGAEGSLGGGELCCLGHNGKSFECFALQW